MEGEEGSGGQRGARATAGDGSYGDKGGLWGETARAACVSVCVSVCVVFFFFFLLDISNIHSLEDVII